LGAVPFPSGVWAALPILFHFILSTASPPPFLSHLCFVLGTPHCPSATLVLLLLYPPSLLLFSSSSPLPHLSLFPIPPRASPLIACSLSPLPLLHPGPLLLPPANFFPSTLDPTYPHLPQLRSHLPIHSFLSSKFSSSLFTRHPFSSPPLTRVFPSPFPYLFF